MLQVKLPYFSPIEIQSTSCLSKLYKTYGWTIELHRVMFTVYRVCVYLHIGSVSVVCVHGGLTKMWDILVAPIRGCAHVKVYLKLFNEAWSNGSWSCRHTSLTLFHWRQWSRRECGVVPSDLATVEIRQLQRTWKKGPHAFDFWDNYLLETVTLGCFSGE